ncbi:MAG: hypothetical protein LXA50_03585 [Betaproteobacteria bacterium]|nr:hypothetical protein [Betaproteobacteria bacterium]
MVEHVADQAAAVEACVRSTAAECVANADQAHGLHHEFLRRRDGALGEARLRRKVFDGRGKYRLDTAVLRVDRRGCAQQYDGSDRSDRARADGAEGTMETEGFSVNDKKHVLKILSEMLDNQAEV